MTGEYFTFTYSGAGDIITFCRTDDGSIFSKIDNAFARANGFADLYAMQEQIYKDGGPALPDWMMWESGLLSGIAPN